jgi:hypothetical protein
VRSNIVGCIYKPQQHINIITLCSTTTFGQPLHNDAYMHRCMYMIPSAMYVCIRKLLSIEYTQVSDCSVMMARYDIPCADRFKSWMQGHHRRHRTAVEWCMNRVIIWLHSAVTCMAPCYCCNAHDNVDIFSPSLQSTQFTVCICVVFWMWIQKGKKGVE